MLLSVSLARLSCASDLEDLPNAIRANEQSEAPVTWPSSGVRERAGQER